MLASRAALAMQERMAEFAALQTRAGTFTLRLRIGVHSGQVFAAQVGDAGAYRAGCDRPQHQPRGAGQEIAEPGEVVISGATSALLARRASTAAVRLSLLERHADDRHAAGWAAGSGPIRAAASMSWPAWPSGWMRCGPICRAVCRAASWSHLSLRAGQRHRRVPPVTVLFANLPFSRTFDMLGTIAILPWAC